MRIQTIKRHAESNGYTITTGVGSELYVSDFTVKLMREWVSECNWGEDYSSADIARLPAETIIRGVQRHYHDGIAGFIANV